MNKFINNIKEYQEIKELEDNLIINFRKDSNIKFKLGFYGNFVFDINGKYKIKSFSKIYSLEEENHINFYNSEYKIIKIHNIKLFIELNSKKYKFKFEGKDFFSFRNEENKQLDVQMNFTKEIPIITINGITPKIDNNKICIIQ